MVSAIFKSAVVCSVVGVLVACGAEAPSDEGMSLAGASTSGGASVAGSAGAGGVPAAAGSNAGAGSSAGGSAGAAGSTPAGGAGSGGQAQAGAGGSGGAGGGSGGAAGGGGMAGIAGAGGSVALDFLLTSPAFEHVEACSAQNHGPCKVFPLANVMTAIGGQNMSPELNWGSGPQGTMSYAITLKDFSNMFTHWAIWNIPAGTLKLPASLSREAMPPAVAGASQKSFSQNDSGYMGPGAKDHIYEFRLYALNVAQFTPKDASDQGKIYNELEANQGNFVLKKVMLRGRSPN